MEIWKDVVGYEGLYQVSDLGRIKSFIKEDNGVLLSLSCNGRGYLKTNLYKSGKRTTRKVHQLVAEAFLNHKPCGYKLVIDHIDCDSYNNKLENLQIVTQRLNNSKDRTGVSVFTGVSWSKYNSKWKSKIQIGQNSKRKSIHLGYFEEEIDAAITYEIALNNIRFYNDDNKAFRELIKSKL